MLGLPVLTESMNPLLETAAAAATVGAAAWATSKGAVLPVRSWVLARRQRATPATAEVVVVPPGPLGQAFGMFVSPPEVQPELQSVRRGAAPSDVEMVALRRLRRAITVHTIGPSAVLLSNARIEVVERTAPDMPFVIDFAGGGGGGAEQVLHLVADLDAESPTAQVGRLRDHNPIPEPTGHEVIVADRRKFTESRPLMINLYARSRRDLVRFNLILDLQIDGKARTLVVQDNGTPFTVSGVPSVDDDHSFVLQGPLRTRSEILR
ncbi:MAG: hypothetical protein E6Q90_03845 [Actinobacteria bacterium]|nr:MAG: hypothetical protein E6Q90_03845 [Actinomycetota bacterium]